MKLIIYIVATVSAMFGVGWFIKQVRSEKFGVLVSRETGASILSVWEKLIGWPGYFVKDEIGIVAPLVYGVALWFIFGRKK